MDNKSPTLIENENSPYSSWISSSASIALSTIGGAIMGGARGGAFGLFTGIADSYAMSYGYLSSHYLSSSAYWIFASTIPFANSAAKHFPQYSLPIYGSAIALGAIMPKITNDFFDFRNKTEIPLESFATINKIFDDKNILSSNEFNKIYNKFFEDPKEAANIISNDFKEIYKNKFLSNFAYNNALSLTQVAIDYLFLSYMVSYSNGPFITNFLDQNKNQAFDKKLMINGLKIIGTFAAKTITNFLIDIKKNAISEEQYNLVIEKTNDIIIENGRKILSTKNGKEIIDNITEDLYKLVFWGAGSLNSVFSKTAKSLISLSSLIKLAPEAPIIYSLTTAPLQYLLKKIALDSKELNEKLAQAQTEGWMIRGDITNHLEQIILRDGKEFSKNQYNNILSEQKSYQTKLAYNDKLTQSLYSFIGYFKNILDLGYFGFKTKIDNPDITKENILRTKQTQYDVDSFISSNLYSALQNTELMISKERIDQLLKIISENNESNLLRTTNNENKIIFKDYLLNMPNKYLSINYLELLGGKHYAFTGESGCGKTSILIDMKESVFGLLSSSGEISTPYDSKIMFINQDPYLPKGATLLQSLYFPNILDSLSENEIQILKNRILDLFDEINIDNGSYGVDNGLKSKLDDTDFKLSGGQAKKITIIQAILNNSNILIMDETFTGLDKASLINTQSLLNKYLPNTTIISVDHHAQDNNYSGFYNEEVHFANNTATINSIGDLDKVFEG